MKVKVFVIEQTESGKAIKCSVDSGQDEPFFLPKSQIKPMGIVKKLAMCEFDIPKWLYLNHRQLCGDEAFEEEKRRREEYDRTRV